jgi:hypothetical protein
VRKDSSVQELDHLANKARGARQRFEPVWFTNLAYYQGNQWLYWNRGKLYEPQLDPWRVTFTDNRLLGIVRTEVAKMTKQRPIFVATPDTGDEEDIGSAQLLERVLSHTWTEHELQRKQRAALLWSRVCGAGFWKVYWDSTTGERRDVLLDQSGQVVLGSDGRPLDPQIISQLPPEAAQNLQVKSVAQGDLCLEVRSPFEMLVDPLAGEEGLDSAEWIIEETVQSSDYVKNKFGVELPEDSEAIAGLAESRMGPTLSGESGPSASYKGVKVREYWTGPVVGQRQGPLRGVGRRQAADRGQRPGRPHALRHVRRHHGARPVLADQRGRAAAPGADRAEQDALAAARERGAHRQPGDAQEPPEQRGLHGPAGRGH